MATIKRDTASTTTTPAATVKRKTKQPPPVRLHEAFYRRMNAAAKVNARSVPKQLEYMVSIAENVARHLTREELIDIESGLYKLVVTKTETPRVDKAALFDSMERMRSTGALSQAVTSAGTKYQACAAHPGYLERINDDGSRDIGMFKGGKFTVAKHLQ